jgi:hypothetical protein
MGRPRKVALKTILALDEINARDPLASRSKSKEQAVEGLIDHHRKAIASGAKRDEIRSPQGLSIGPSIPALIVAKLPLDLPAHYRKRLTDETLVLVDGYQRYEALRRKYGLEVRISVQDTEAETMADLMRKALEANYRHPLPLSADEKKAHVFRLLLLGAFDEGIDRLLTQFSDVFSRSTLAEYKKAAEFARQEARIDGLPPEEAKIALREHLKVALGDLVPPRYDSKGYPVKAIVSAWLQIVETGDVSKWIEKREREAERRADEASLIKADLRYFLKDKTPQAALQALREQEAIIRKKVGEVPDKDFLELFGEG